MIYRLVRGGSYYTDSGSWLLRTTFRFWYLPESRFRLKGFRIVVRREA